jgi:hypothetical protein
MKYYKPEEALEFIQREWANNPLKVGEGANPVFCTVEGIQQQIKSLYDTKGTMFFFVQKGDLVELVPLELDYEIVRPEGYKILGHSLD